MRMTQSSCLWSDTADITQFAVSQRGGSRQYNVIYYAGIKPPIWLNANV